MVDGFFAIDLKIIEQFVYVVVSSTTFPVTVVPFILSPFLIEEQHQFN